jgi:protein-L-isoaspartate O-methyltransferase
MNTLVASLHAQRIVRSDILRKAMVAVDRSFFAPNVSREEVYADSPLPIGDGSTNMSAPSVHGLALQQVQDVLEFNQACTSPLRALDLGTGSGYVCAFAPPAPRPLPPRG